MTKHIQVYRFRGAVACYIGRGETVYLTPRDARAFAWAISATAKDIDDRSFTMSMIGTFERDCEDGRD